MKILTELLDILEEAKKKKGVTRSMRAKVYRADYIKTKHKPYRKYDQQERHED